MCRVTLDLQKYLDVYNAVDTNTHYLAEGQERYFNLVLFSDGNKWYTVWDSTITAYITCTQPTTEDITLSYADTHGDPITGLPDAVTRTVAHGEKASFTVAAGPTCDENKHTFASWNAMPDGSGDSYAPGATIELSASATLYAQWNDSNSGGDDNEPTNPPSSGENGDIEKALYGKNVTVRCVNNENAHEEKPYDAKLGLTSASPVKIDAGLTLGETTYKTAYEIKLSADKFVDLYSKSTAEGGSGEAHHRKDGTAAELTWIIYWDASLSTDNKWAAYENDQKIVEAEHTVTEPTTPPSTEELRPLLGKVEVDCVDRTVEHDTLEYDAVDGLVEGSLQKVAGGYQTGSGQRYDTAYTCTLSGAKFAQLYSGKTTDTPAGSGVAHTLKTPETITCAVAWNPSEGKWFAVKETPVIQTTHAEYTVTFKYQVNGYSDKTQTVVAGSTVTKPADERREGYTLEGWYETAACTGEKFNFTTPINANKILYAKWTARTDIPYTVKYLEEGTNKELHAAKTGTGTFNTTVQVTAEAISGYTLVGSSPRALKLENVSSNELIFYYTKNVGTQVAYTIRYLKEGTGEALLPAYSGTGVAGNSLTVTAPAIDGYTALAPTSYTITLNAEAAENIITFYYREATSTIPAGEPAKEPFNKNANPRQLNRDDHFAYIKGYPDGTVRPEASLTRAEAAAILYRVMEKSCVERFHAESSSFRDVPDGKWYTTYVATLEKAGVIVDSKNGNFRPNDAITRAELASMLAQFANVTGGTNTFSDVPATHWAADYIAAAVRSGWIQGYPDGTFRPEQTIKRAEMTAMVNRALGRDPQSASDLLEGMKTWKDNADPTAWFYLDIQEAANGHTYARKTGGEYWTGLVADVVQ